ncbi:MAG: endonuclease/exonuclease/phosphatase family protein, partial [Cyclobacteriaceae bacterium]
SGQAILSKYPLSNEETVVLQKPINAPFYYNKFYLDRLVQIADVQVGDRVVKVMNVHLEAFDPETTESQAKVVKQLYERYASQMPVILMGDFNSSPGWANPEDKALDIITSAENLDTAIRQPKDSENDYLTYTFSTGKPEKSIDHIFYNPAFIEMVDWDVLTETGEISDHFPVIMKFTFTSENDSVVSE